MEKFERKSKNELDCITLNIESNTQRLDDVQEVNYAFKYYPSSDKITAGTRVKYNNPVYGSGIDSTGMFIAPIDGLYQFDFEIGFLTSSSYYIRFEIRKNSLYGKLV